MILLEALTEKDRNLTRNKEIFLTPYSSNPAKHHHVASGHQLWSATDDINILLFQPGFWFVRNFSIEISLMISLMISLENSLIRGYYFWQVRYHFRSSSIPFMVNKKPFMVSNFPEIGKVPYHFWFLFFIKEGIALIIIDLTKNVDIIFFSLIVIVNTGDSLYFEQPVFFQRFRPFCNPALFLAKKFCKSRPGNWCNQQISFFKILKFRTPETG